jgi:hypothetical protein
LKPDVCRRVVGRLPSPHIQISLQKLFWSTARDGATIQPPPCVPELNQEEQVEVHGGLSCEIVSDLCPNPFSHDWHVQPSCQRPNRLPPERRAFSSRRTRCKQRIRLSSKPFKHIVRAKPCQRSHPTVFPRVFHIGNAQDAPSGSSKAQNSAQRYRLPLWIFAKTPIPQRMPKRKTEN